MSAQDYGLTPGRGFNPPSHNGKDWAAPMGTYVFPGDSRILTGNTGLSTGPHLHTQAGSDFYAQNPIDPTRHEFMPGQVVQVGWGDEWGNYVIVKNFTSGVFVVYAHLSDVGVIPGDVVGEDMIDKELLKDLFRHYLGRDPSDKERAKFVDKMTVRELRDLLKNGPTFLKRMESVKSTGYDITRHLPSALRSRSVLFDEFKKCQANEGDFEPVTDISELGLYRKKTN